jgi:NAD(P)-dependent dehydrogenase (short-subunit alcohol dehydrogenase family)
MRLEGKVALITGAGSGIGQATAVLFAREGAKVAAVDLREDAAKATAEQIEKSGGQALPIRADVSKSADNQAAIQQAVARWGRLDVFYANAGVPQFPTSVESVDEAVFDQIMAVNVKAPLELGCRALPIMAARGGGSIINMSSVAALRGGIALVAYSAAKGGILSFTRAHDVRGAAYFPGTSSRLHPGACTTIRQSQGR